MEMFFVTVYALHVRIEYLQSYWGSHSVPYTSSPLVCQENTTINVCINQKDSKNTHAHNNTPIYTTMLLCHCCHGNHGIVILKLPYRLTICFVTVGKLLYILWKMWWITLSDPKLMNEWFWYQTLFLINAAYQLCILILLAVYSGKTLRNILILPTSTEVAASFSTAKSKRPLLCYPFN